MQNLDGFVTHLMYWGLNMMHNSLTQ